MENEIRPIILTDTETGEKYTLEFNADTVKYAQYKGFDIDNIDKTPAITIPDLFMYSFRMHHKNLSPVKIQKLFDDLGGMPNGMLERLAELYLAPIKKLFNDEGETKNAKVTVEL